jgi:hypothetical protein
MAEKRSAYSVLVRKSERKRPLGRSRRRIQCNIIMDLKEMGWKEADWVHVGWDRNQ